MIRPASLSSLRIDGCMRGLFLATSQVPGRVSFIRTKSSSFFERFIACIFISLPQLVKPLMNKACQSTLNVLLEHMWLGWIQQAECTAPIEKAYNQKISRSSNTHKLRLHPYSQKSSFHLHLCRRAQCSPVSCDVPCPALSQSVRSAPNFSNVVFMLSIIYLATCKSKMLALSSFFTCEKMWKMSFSQS